mmetsp:Transcript_33565/g.92948  ORF Transcript_33565/g.92948 Transcript_33565/m.92948 type:complete len:266 (+) Transcript_33565:766-1563(+)
MQSESRLCTCGIVSPVIPAGRGRRRRTLRNACTPSGEGPQDGFPAVPSAMGGGASPRPVAEGGGAGSGPATTAVTAAASTGPGPLSGEVPRAALAGTAALMLQPTSLPASLPLSLMPSSPSPERKCWTAEAMSRAMLSCPAASLASALAEARCDSAPPGGAGHVACHGRPSAPPGASASQPPPPPRPGWCAPRSCRTSAPAAAACAASQPPPTPAPAVSSPPLHGVEGGRLGRRGQAGASPQVAQGGSPAAPPQGGALLPAPGKS